MSQESLNQLDNELGTNPVEAIPVPAPNAPEPLSMGAVLRVVTMRRLWFARRKTGLAKGEQETSQRRANSERGQRGTSQRRVRDARMKERSAG